jgi:hypothetical protein
VSNIANGTEHVNTKDKDVQKIRVDAMQTSETGVPYRKPLDSASFSRQQSHKPIRRRVRGRQLTSHEITDPLSS